MIVPHDKVLTGTARVQANFDVLIHVYDAITDEAAYKNKAERSLSLRLTNAGFRLDEFAIIQVTQMGIDPPAESSGD